MADFLTTQEHIARARLLGFTGYNKNVRVYFSHDMDSKQAYVDCNTLEPVSWAEYEDRMEMYRSILAMGDGR